MNRIKVLIIINHFAYFIIATYQTLKLFPAMLSWIPYSKLQINFRRNPLPKIHPPVPNKIMIFIIIFFSFFYKQFHLFISPHFFFCKIKINYLIKWKSILLLYSQNPWLCQYIFLTFSYFHVIAIKKPKSLQLKSYSSHIFPRYCNWKSSSLQLKSYSSHTFPRHFNWKMIIKQKCVKTA
jgi:hypothetical protein